MDHQASEDSESRFAAYVEGLTGVIGHADRAAPLRDYCVGLLAAEGRKSVEPMAAVTAPAGLSVQHQKLLHFVANAPWSDERVLAKVREMVVPAMERRGRIEAWIIDDTAFPKQGTHSVGVHHQYCGQLGKQANCQVVVTLSIANHHASLPIAYRLYLPQAWTKDAGRRHKAHVPKAIKFKTKPQIALAQLRADGCELRFQHRAAHRCRRAGAQLRGRNRVDGQSARGGGSRCAAPERQGPGARPTATCLAHDHPAGGLRPSAALALRPAAGAHRADAGRRR